MRSDSAPGPALYFSPREVRILQLLEQGKWDDQIAGHLHLHTLTVTASIHTIMAKLQADTRIHAVMRARYLGIIRIENPW